VTGNKFNTEDLQILGGSIRNKVARVTWHTCFVGFWFSLFECSILMQISYQASFKASGF